MDEQRGCNNHWVGGLVDMNARTLYVVDSKRQGETARARVLLERVRRFWDRLGAEERYRGPVRAQVIRAAAQPDEDSYSCGPRVLDWLIRMLYVPRSILQGPHWQGVACPERLWVHWYASFIGVKTTSIRLPLFVPYSDDHAARRQLCSASPEPVVDMSQQVWRARFTDATGLRWPEAQLVATPGALCNGTAAVRNAASTAPVMPPRVLSSDQDKSSPVSTGWRAKLASFTSFLWSGSQPASEPDVLRSVAVAKTDSNPGVLFTPPQEDAVDQDMPATPVVKNLKEFNISTPKGVPPKKKAPRNKPAVKAASPVKIKVPPKQATPAKEPGDKAARISATISELYDFTTPGQTRKTGRAKADSDDYTPYVWKEDTYEDLASRSLPCHAGGWTGWAALKPLVKELEEKEEE